MKSIKLGVMSLAVTLALVPAAAFAGTDTENLSVTASVGNNCSIATTTLAFGAYDPAVVNAATPLDGTGAVSVTCTEGTSPTIELALGSFASGSVRRMKHASSLEYLTYQLYSDSERATMWGTGATDDVAAGAAPDNTARSFTVYGRVAANQSVPSGSYSDTVLATVNF